LDLHIKSKNYLKNNINAFILAGGKGKRLTSRKSLIRINDKPIIEDTISVLSHILKQVNIISNNRDLYSPFNIPILPDEFINSGPKGGIYTGLYNSDTLWNYFVACDMPFISESAILKLSEYISNDYDCIIPFINGYYEPLFAFYNRNCLQELKKSIELGNYKIQSIFDKVKIRKVTKRDFGSSVNFKKLFTNINTASDVINLRKSVF